MSRKKDVEKFLQHEAKEQPFEARRYCKGDGAWSNWQPCTALQADMYKLDETFQVRARKAGKASE